MTIEIEDLIFSYEKTPILEQISLRISQGEFIGIFGPNGGGKTTFLKLLLGFNKPDKGVIRIFGNPPEEMRGILGYVPQMKHFDKQFPISVLEVVLQGSLSRTSWWGGYLKTEKNRARDFLKKVQLEEKENAAFGTLSGGQIQRALIARALMGDPKILLLDEPTASVDANAEQIIYELLLSLKGKITILMVTHDLQPILDKAGRLLCIHRQLTSYLPKEVCDHFALGLYHPKTLFEPKK